jgi:hypothetical protein
MQECLKQFPVNNAYMPEVMKRLSLARQIDRITRKNSQASAPIFFINNIAVVVVKAS